MSFDEEKVRAGRRRFTVVELDLDFCALTYGVAPCQAALGVTGSAKCYNTRGTCQDSVNYSRTVRTYRFCSDVADVPRELAALPFIQAVSITPTKLQIGAGLGERGGVTVELSDGKHNDVDIDPYVAERSYDPERQGTYFGRLIARNGYYLGRPLRVLTGYLTRDARGGSVWDPANAETRTYFIEKIAGPDPGGRVTITAKDILKLADDDRAQAPRPAIGRLSADISAAATSLVLLPAGVGDLSHGTTGKVRINGEIISYNRTAGSDTLTLTARGQNFTTAAAHSTDDAVQECLQFSGQRAHQVINTLLTEYAGVAAAYIPLADWQDEDETYNQRLYNALIAEPTGVNQLIREILEQGPAYLWWDDVAAEVVYRALRPASSAALELSDESSFVAGSVQVQDRLDLRISECWVYFGQRNPTEPVDKRSNYAAVFVLVGDGETANKYGQPRVKEIFARFLTSSARTFAEEIAGSVIQRYDEVPKQIDFTILPKESLATGGLFNALTRLVQGADGARQSAVFQALSLAPQYEDDSRRGSALQERYVPSATAGQRILVISSDQIDYNLRIKHDELYAAPTEPVTVLLIIEAGTITGSSAPSIPALDIGAWPAGSDITVDNRGRVQGRGGDGGGGGFGHFSGAVWINDQLPDDGGPGATALYTRFPITLKNGTGKIYGGGGGGGGGGAGFVSSNNNLGGGGGGGGAGREDSNGGEAAPSSGSDITSQAEPGEPGLLDTPGAGGPGATAHGTNHDGGGGDGGDPGANGDPGRVSTSFPTNPVGGAGPAGNAIDGNSFITFSGAGDIRGPQIN